MRILKYSNGQRKDLKASNVAIRVLFCVSFHLIGHKGFILENFPGLEEAAKSLFPLDSEEDKESAAAPGILPPTKAFVKLTLEFVFALNATDDWLRERVINLSEEDAVSLGLTETGFRPSYLISWLGLEFPQKLSEYRAQHNEDTSVLNYFDFNEIHPKTLGMNIS